LPHSATGAPPLVICGRPFNTPDVSALLTSRSPYDAVSTSTLLTTWQVDVPGTQIFTLTVGMLITRAAPGPTVITAVFAVLPSDTLEPPPLLPPLRRRWCCRHCRRRRRMR
jgi:hypothetical protein